MYVLLYLKNYLITYIQRFRLLSYCLVLATEDTTLTQQVSHRLLKCRSRSWSQRGTKVNGSHHGDNRYSDQQGSKSRQNPCQVQPTENIGNLSRSFLALTILSEGYTKTRYATLYKQWHQPKSKRFIKPPFSISRATSIDSDCCRLPTASALSNKVDNHAPISFDQQAQVFQGHTPYRNKETYSYWY